MESVSVNFLVPVLSGRVPQAVQQTPLFQSQVRYNRLGTTHFWLREVTGLIKSPTINDLSWQNVWNVFSCATLLLFVNAWVVHVEILFPENHFRKVLSAMKSSCSQSAFLQIEGCGLQYTQTSQTVIDRIVEGLETEAIHVMFYIEDALIMQSFSSPTQ